MSLLFGEIRIEADCCIEYEQPEFREEERERAKGDSCGVQKSILKEKLLTQLHD